MADEEKKFEAETEEVEGEANESVEAPGIVAGITAGLIDREITNEVQTAFLSYSMSVIEARAIPEFKDVSSMA